MQIKNRVRKSKKQKIPDKNIQILIYYILLSFIVFSRLYADASAGADFLLAQPDARTAAMANCFAAVADDSNAVLFNPAGLVLCRHSDFSLTYFSSFASTSYEYFDFAVPCGRFGFGGSLLYDSTGNFDLINSNGQDLGAIINYDIVTTAAFGYMIIPGLSAGAAIKLFQSRIFTYIKYGMAYDGGLIYKINEKEPEVNIACVLQNMGWQSAYDTQKEPLPLNLETGISVKYKFLDYYSMIFDVDLNQQLLISEYPDAGLGAEIGFYDMLYLRGGYAIKHDGENLALGAGIVLFKSVSLSYAFQPFGDLGAVHRLSLDMFF